MAQSGQAEIPPRIIVVMGVSASGKTALAGRLHATLGWPFQDADDLHPLSNIEKMASGTPLTDEDRIPWLEICGQWIAEQARAGQGGILACSALKKHYRDILRKTNGPITFLFLRVPRSELERRMHGRRKHFMPVSLLDSQLETLEEPYEEDDVLVVDAVGSPLNVTAHVLRLLQENAEQRP